MAEGMVTTSISLHPEQLQALRDWARVEDRNVSSLVRTLIKSPLDAWLKQQERQAALMASRPAPRTPVAAAARTFEE